MRLLLLFGGCVTWVLEWSGSCFACCHELILVYCRHGTLRCCAWWYRSIENARSACPLLCSSRSDLLSSHPCSCAEYHGFFEVICGSLEILFFCISPVVRPRNLVCRCWIGKPFLQNRSDSSGRLLLPDKLLHERKRTADWCFVTYNCRQSTIPVSYRSAASCLSIGPGSNRTSCSWWWSISSGVSFGADDRRGLWRRNRWSWLGFWGQSVYLPIVWAWAAGTIQSALWRWEQTSSLRSWHTILIFTLSKPGFPFRLWTESLETDLEKGDTNLMRARPTFTESHVMCDAQPFCLSDLER